MSDESPWGKLPEVPQFTGLTLEEALAIADAPRDPVFGIQFAQISATFLPQDKTDPYVSFQCGLEVLRALGFIYRHDRLKLSEMMPLTQRLIPGVGIDTVATWLQAMRDAFLIKGSPADGFSIYMADRCTYTFIPDREDADQTRLNMQ